jgi:hypothetical protein
MSKARTKAGLVNWFDDLGGRGKKYMISAIDADGKQLWSVEHEQVQVMSIPVYFGGHEVETLVRDGRVMMRLVGRHAQNSKEVTLKFSDLGTSSLGHDYRINTLLLPLLSKLKEEDRIFDRLSMEER